MQCGPEPCNAAPSRAAPTAAGRDQASTSMVRQIRVLGQRRRKAGSLLPAPSQASPGENRAGALLTHNLCNGTLFPVNICYAKVQPRQALLQGGTGSTPDSRPREQGPAPCTAPAARPCTAPPFCTAGSEIAADLNLSLRWASGRWSKPCKGLAGAERHTAPGIPGAQRGLFVTGGSPEPGFSPSPPLRAALCKCRPGAPLPPPVSADSGSPGHGIL